MLEITFFHSLQSWIYFCLSDALATVDYSMHGYTEAQYNKMLKEDSRYYTRNRGLFRTCYSGNSTWFFKEVIKYHETICNIITLYPDNSWSCTNCNCQSFRMLLIILKIIQADPSDKDGSCLREISYDFEDDPTENTRQTSSEEDNYDLRKHLMRSHLGFFILGIVLLAIAIIVTTIGCWCLWITVCVPDTICSKLDISVKIN